jgi:hypothetical protein
LVEAWLVAREAATAVDEGALRALAALGADLAALVKAASGKKAAARLERETLGCRRRAPFHACPSPQVRPASPPGSPR